MNIISTSSEPTKCNKSSFFVESPQNSLCSPSCHNPVSSFPLFFTSSALSSTSNSSSSNSNPLSDSSNPKESMSIFSKSLRVINSSESNSKSQSLNSATLLSASLNALICSSVRSSAIMTGTSSIPRDRAANLRVWPATMTFSSSTIIGTLNPNSLILAATLSTASSLINLGLFSYSFNSDIFMFVIFIISPPIIFYLLQTYRPSTRLTRSVMSNRFQAIKNRIAGNGSATRYLKLYRTFQELYSNIQAVT